MFQPCVSLHQCGPTVSATNYNNKKLSWTQKRMDNKKKKKTGRIDMQIIGVFMDLGLCLYHYHVYSQLLPM